MNSHCVCLSGYVFIAAAILDILKYLIFLIVSFLSTRHQLTSLILA